MASTLDTNRLSLHRRAVISILVSVLLFRCTASSFQCRGGSSSGLIRSWRTAMTVTVAVRVVLKVNVAIVSVAVRVAGRLLIAAAVLRAKATG